MARTSDDNRVLERLEHVESLIGTVGHTAIGDRLRRARNAQGLSIREVADKAGVNKNSVVRLEQGRGSTATTVIRVCAALELHVERLVEGHADGLDLAALHHKEDNHWYDLNDPASSELPDARVRKGSLPVCILKSALEQGRVRPSILRVTERTRDRSHVGEEFVFVLSGRASIRVGKTEHVLRKGESMAFWSAEPHSYASADPRKVVEFLCVRVEGDDSRKSGR